MGLTGYYKRFIKGYASLAGPLTDLLRKDAFKWSTNADEAFSKLKQGITSAPVLALPNFKHPFILETDASGSGVGAVLSQNGHPIAYFSKKLSPRMQKQSAYTRELFTITESLAKFRHYLLGHQFIILTDQRSLKSLLDQSLQTPEQQAWLHKFIGYDFKIEYKPGRDNIAADALSRVMVLSWSEPQNQLLQQLKDELAQQDQLANTVRLCQNNAPPDTNYSVKEGLLYWKGRLVLPNQSSLIQKVLWEYHSSPIGGHAGITRTMARVMAQFYWPKMKEDIKRFVQHCTICQQAKTVNL